MPWHIVKQDEMFCVVKESDGKTVKCHTTREEAKSHLAALYVNEPSAAKKSTGYGLLKSLITERVEELKACGANKPGGGGFSAGNTCARGGGGSAGGPENPTVSSVRGVLSAGKVSAGKVSSTGFTSASGAMVKKNETTGNVEVTHATKPGANREARDMERSTKLGVYQNLLSEKGYRTTLDNNRGMLLVHPKED